jgi:hypothetical protein
MDQASPGSADAADQMGLGKAMDALAGDFGIVVTPGSGPVPAGAVLMATDDEAAMQDFMDGIATLATSLATEGDSTGSMGSSMDGTLPLADMTPAATWQTEEYKGVTISYLVLPDTATSGVAPSYVVTDGMAIIATSPDEIKKLIDAHGGSQITSSPNYGAAMAHADAVNTGMFYMDMEAVIQAAAGASGDSGSVVEDMKPFKAIVMTSGGTSEKPTATLFILIK